MNCSRREGLWRAAEGYCTPKRVGETSSKLHTACQRKFGKDRPRHTNGGAAIFFDEVASGSGSAVEVDCAE